MEKAHWVLLPFTHIPTSPRPCLRQRDGRATTRLAYGYVGNGIFCRAKMTVFMDI